MMGFSEKSLMTWRARRSISDTVRGISVGTFRDGGYDAGVESVRKRDAGV